MHRFVVLACAALWLATGVAQAQDAYSGVVLEYLSGNPDVALGRLRALDRAEILAGVQVFDRTRASRVLQVAAALHTEAAFRKASDGTYDAFHLGIATALVEFGERVRRKSNATHTVAPLFAPPVSDKFRQLWYCVVITGLHDSPQFATATKYLDHALDLYPRDPEIQLLAGINHELRSSPRTKALVPKNIPDGSLRDAEAHFRAALAAQPDRQEARLRLGRLLLHRGNLAEARTMLTPLVSTEDPRLAYLAALFLGGVEDASRNPDAALTLYDRAVSGLGAHAQSARLAASELRHRKGDRLAAADAVLPATGDNTEFDPWWGYIFGEYWLLDSRLDSLRGLRRG